MNIYIHMREQIATAGAFAEDGAFHTAARILRELADKVEEHAKQSDVFLDAMIAEGKVEREEQRHG